jgi:GLPGLI family protein
MQKNVYGSNFNIEDSIPKLEWKISNENRVIAGFNCRKAVAKIFDSVYVFAFYTDEILIPGGPCSINGLPGMILGVTIPRLYTSWIATKVSVIGVDENAIKPAAVKKIYTMKFLRLTLDDRIKDWSADNDEEQQQKNRFVWTILL